MLYLIFFLKKDSYVVTAETYWTLLAFTQFDFVLSFHFLLKVNRSVYMTSCTYRFCWQHAIILVWKTWSRVKGRVCYIFTTLFCKFKGEHLRNKEKCFLFHLKISFHSWDNQILILQIFKCYYVIKCPSMIHQTHFTE